VEGSWSAGKGKDLILYSMVTVVLLILMAALGLPPLPLVFMGIIVIGLLTANIYLYDEGKGKD